MKEKLPLLIALIFGVIAFVGINQYLQSQKTVQQVVRRLAAASALPEGHILQERDFRELAVPADYFRGVEGFFDPDDKARIINQPLSRSVQAGELIAASHLALEGGLDSPRIDRFSMKLQPGERAVSLPLDSIGSVSDFIRVDDRVDILANIDIPKVVQRTFTIPNEGVQTVDEMTYEATTIFLFENVPVLAVGDTYEELGPNDIGFSSGGDSITISVTPREAQVLAWAMRNGGTDQRGGEVTFTLLLRSPEDEGLVPQRELVTYEDLLDMTNMEALQDMRFEIQPSQPQIFQGGIPVNQGPRP